MTNSKKPRKGLLIAAAVLIGLAAILYVSTILLPKDIHIQGSLGTNIPSPVGDMLPRSATA